MMRCINKNIKFISILTLSLCLILVFLGCTQKYSLTISKADESHLIEKLNKCYAAGEKVTVKVSIIMDADVEIYLDGESLEEETLVKVGDTFSHWEYYFIMPNHNATLTLKVVGGMSIETLFD